MYFTETPQIEEEDRMNRKSRALVFLMVIVLAFGLVLPMAAQSKPLKIAFFVSDLSNNFHQAQFAAAKAYAKAKYGADVFAFDGKSDSEVMTANIDQVVAQGMDMASLHIWDGDAAKPGVEAAIAKGIVMTAFFSPVSDTGIPVARSDEAHISFTMGAEMATQWKKAFPNKPIVMVELGWPNNTEVQTGRTGPFVKGVQSVDKTAKDLGCLDSSKGPDAAKQIVTDLAAQHAEVNLIYAESGDLCVGVMAALNQAGRGKMKNGVPLTEIVCSCDFDAVQFKQVYDPNSSLKLSLGLPPIETGQGRIELMMDVKNGLTDQVSQPAQEFFYKAYNISYYTMPKADTIKWLNSEFGTKL
jgi:ABC-type sugar transport system substrate-binding protein